MAAPKTTRTAVTKPVINRREETALSSVIGKLSDAIGNLALSVATQKERLDNVDRRADSHAKDINRLEESQPQIHQRIATVQQDLTQKMADQTEQLKTHLDNSVSKIEGLVKESDKKREDGDKAILERVGKLEIWRWVIVGGGMVAAVVMSGVIWKIVAAVIDKIDWVKFFGG